ncbi:16S rRNA (cytosine(1402)-N(4))-methyltransferase RsmH [Patescibacteria group bacterium]|nr:16S rRNA (cytosine(1402)-N(4))-methyltransferase RsmH [Patescibacteria group bacterium]
MQSGPTSFHTPVLLREVLQYLQPKPGDVFVDGTLGGAGHAAEFARAVAPNGTVVGIDLDPAAVQAAEQRIKAQNIKSNTIFIQGNYRDIGLILAARNITQANGILIDIGISSYDLNASQRGFTFQKDEPLDMRFNPDEHPENKRKQPLTAQFIINHYSEKELKNIFDEYGEEKFSGRIAKAILAERQQKAINSTLELFQIIKKSLPAAIRFKAGDSARRIFQALRIEVNAELDNLTAFLPEAFRLLVPQGRLAVISFHSLEDRIVKQYFAEMARGCICPPDFPKCVCGRNPLARIITKKPVTASPEEISENPRSAPAKMRVIEKI